MTQNRPDPDFLLAHANRTEARKHRHEDVGRFAGIRVWETVPDTVFDEADEVELVDLPPDELLARLREGKVYLPEKAGRAL
jgi:two-component system sensor histidine kinase KdpD